MLPAGGATINGWNYSREKQSLEPVEADSEPLGQSVAENNSMARFQVELVGLLLGLSPEAEEAYRLYCIFCIEFYPRSCRGEKQADEDAVHLQLLADFQLAHSAICYPSRGR